MHTENAPQSTSQSGPQHTLRAALESNQFAITAELMPPKGPDVTEFLHNAERLRGRVHAVNVTDCSRSILRMSSMASAALLVRQGIDAVYQLTCRDRNVLALQSDLLGASALGIRNVLALTGDGIRHGDHPEVKAIFEVESLGLLRLIYDLNRSINATGGTMNAACDLLPGAAVNPNYIPGTSHRKRFRKKVEGGARFFQTQMLTSFDAFHDFMAFARPLGAKVLGGILLIKSLKNALFLNNKVPGIHIGDDILKRFEAADGLDTGLTIAAEQVKRCADLCDGVHLMVLGREDLIPEILNRAGF